MTAISSPPRPVPLPKLALWMAAHGIKPPQAEAALGVRANHIRKFVRPFGAADRIIPKLPIMERIVAWTGGAVRPKDFYPPELNGEGDGEGGPAAWPAQAYAVSDGARL